MGAEKGDDGVENVSLTGAGAQGLRVIAGEREEAVAQGLVSHDGGEGTKGENVVHRPCSSLPGQGRKSTE